jgi:hypothetical protein
MDGSIELCARDTAIVMEVVKGNGFFKIDLPPGQKKKEGRKIKELLCKPH